MLWYYVKDGARQGPMEEAELSRLAGQNVVRPDTLVWCDGMNDWSPYSTAAPSTRRNVPAAPEITPEPQVVEVPIAAEPEPRSEPSPEPAPAPSALVAAAAPAPVAAQTVYCTQCGRPYPSEEMVRFGAAAICVNCKDIYAQRLRETGQVTAAHVYGGFWLRFVAVFIDSIILGTAFFALAVPTGLFLSTSRDLGALMMSTGLLNLVALAVGLLYESFFLVRYGATPGKMIFKLKVITPEGGGLTWGRAIGRYFAKMLSYFTLMIGFIMAGFDSEKRALHDYIAATRVIRTA